MAMLATCLSTYYILKNPKISSQMAKYKEKPCVLMCLLVQSREFNKLTSVFHASVLLLIMNFVITLSK